MEDTLRVLLSIIDRSNLPSLNPCFNGRYSQSKKLLRLRIRMPVLILVLMEDTLRVQLQVTSAKTQSLNPCFNGRYSQSSAVVIKQKKFASLNPCFNGRYSQS